MAKYIKSWKELSKEKSPTHFFRNRYRALQWMDTSKR